MDDDFELETLIAERDEPTLSSSPVMLLPSQQRHVELISHLSAYSELLIAVIGAEGSGKTTLAHALVAQRQAPDETVFFTATPTFGIPALLQAMAQQWQLPQLASQRANALDQLTQFATERYAMGGQLLVVIDHAEQLDVDTLNDIAHLALLMPQHLSFALFGLAGFERALRSSPAHAPVHVLPIDPLDEQESQQLARHLLGQTLSPVQLQSAQAASQGWIGPMIAQLEDQQRADHEQNRAVASKMQATHTAAEKARSNQVAGSAQKAPFPLTHILGSAALVAILLLAYVYQRSDDSSQNTELTTALSNEVMLADEAVVTVEREQALAALLESAEATDFNFSNDAEPIEPAEQATSAAEQPSSLVAPPSAVPAEAPRSVERVVAKPDTPKQALPVAQAKQATSAPAIRVPFDGAVLLSQRQGYVVQLLGVRDVKAAQQYRERWQGEIGQRLYLYQTVYQQQPWFVVVAGVYDNETAARRAVQQYPARIQANSPWVRPIDAVHDALR